MWYYSISNEQQGPVDEGAIQQLIHNGVLDDASLVWKEGMSDWQPLGGSALASLVSPRGGTATAVAPRPAAPQRRPAAAAVNPYSAPQTNPVATTHAPAQAMGWKNVLFSFQGRIPRRTFWAATGILMAIYLVGIIISTLLSSLTKNSSITFIPMIPVFLVYCYGSFAIQIKRWHDRGKSGWMVLIALIPLVGGIWAFVECGCLRGTVGDNQYGSDPT